MNDFGNYEPSRHRKRTRVRGWILKQDLPRSPRADAVIADLLDRLAQHHREDTLPRGPRGMFYDLRPYGIPGNSRGIGYTKHPTPQQQGKGGMGATPEYVTDTLGLMRRVWDPETREWLVPEDWISDGRMPDPVCPSEVEDADEAARICRYYIEGLLLARQAGQQVFLEIRTEAADLMPRIARIANPYGVSVYSGSGMDGLKTKKEAAERAARRKIPTLCGHLADYDDSGGNIADAFAEDAMAFAKWHRDYGEGTGALHVVRLALTEAQAIEHGLLDDDGTAEVDGLPVPVLDALVRNWIESHLDAAIQRAVVEAEPKMRMDAARQLGKWPKLKSGGVSDTNEDWSWARS
jgi:hypothetical protein